MAQESRVNDLNLTRIKSTHLIGQGVEKAGHMQGVSHTDMRVYTHRNACVYTQICVCIHMLVHTRSSTCA